MKPRMVFRQSLFQDTFSSQCCFSLRELSFLKLGTGVEESLEGYQIFWPCFIGVSNISEKIVKYLMGCEIFAIYLRRSYLKMMMIR